MAHMQMQLECCYIKLENSQWENLNHLFSRKVSLLGIFVLIYQIIFSACTLTVANDMMSGIAFGK